MSNGLWSLRTLLPLCVTTALLAQNVSTVSLNDTLLPWQAAPVAPYFQVYEPVLTPASTAGECSQLLMEHVFAFSYQHPFVSQYKPPNCAFNRVTMNFTVTSKGRQFDRLGIMYLGDIEVFRTSTAEPTRDGIEWTYVKEMHQYNALWGKEQKLIFDLGNLIDDTYTASFNATLTATFFTVPDSKPTADFILPISSKSSAEDKGSAFAIPGPIAAVAYTLPQNIDRAVVSLSACGQNAEEFWYSNVFSSEVDTFPDTADTLNGYSPFREAQLLIDGQLAGVSWPFPVIFTGGIVPGLWQPIVGIDTFDLRQHEIEITPWLPLLCDGAEHTFEIRVAGLNDDGNNHAALSDFVGSHWVVTGTIFMFFDKPGAITTGSAPKANVAPPSIQLYSNITTDDTGANQTLTYNTKVSREISIASTLRTSQGSRPVSWNQRLSYSSSNNFSSQGYFQTTKQITTASDASSSGYVNTYKYPLELETSFSEDMFGGLKISANLSRGLAYNVSGPSIFPYGIQDFNITSPSLVSIPGRTSLQAIKLPDSIPLFSGALLSTTQTGIAQYSASGYGTSGTTTQNFDFKGVELSDPHNTYELYHRHVKAVDTKVTEDQQILAGRTIGNATTKPQAQQYAFLKGSQPKISAPSHDAPAVGGFSVRALLGRGPGQSKDSLLGPGSFSNISTAAIDES